MLKIPQPFPWWLTIIFAATCYYSLKYLIPSLVPETSSTMYNLAQAAPTLAPIITIVFLLLGAKQLYDPIPGQEETTKNAEEDDPQNETTSSPKGKI